jgi:DNA-binding NarL/FixJ family response regulator
MDRACEQSLIYEADTVKEVLCRAKRHLIQMALVDVVLGHDTENGIQCARRLRTLDPQMRVVLISAHPDREFHRQGIEAGAVAFLDKKRPGCIYVAASSGGCHFHQVSEKASVIES